MAIEPVNERPIFPSVTRIDAVGLGNWSVSMVRQLTTVFQQYGYRLNNALLNEDLAAEDGTIAEIDEEQTWTATQTFTPAQVFSHAPNATGNPLRWDDLAENGGSIGEVDRTNTWVPAQVFQAAPTATGHPLRWDELAKNGGTIPETNRVNNFTSMQQHNGSAFFQSGSNSNGEWFILFGVVQICRVKRFVLPFSAAERCLDTWTFPRAFAGTDYVVQTTAIPPNDGDAAFAYASNANPTTFDISDFGTGNYTTTSCQLEVSRVGGRPDFLSGDEMYVNVVVIGTPS